MDRPSRKTKVVSYCEAKDFEDDDEDFACVKAPPNKKPREDVKQEPKKSSSSKSSSQESSSQPPASRKPLDEKLYQRDLEAAITLSLLNNADKTKEPISKGQLPVDENTDPASLHISNCSVDAAVMGLDKIISEERSPAPQRQRKPVSKVTEEPKKQDEDEDYEPKLTPDSESDEDFSGDAESEDEEFTVKKSSSKTKTKEKEKTTKKNKPTPAAKKEKQTKPTKKFKTQEAAPIPIRTPPAPKPAPRKPHPSSSTKPAPASLSPAGGRVPKWTPPAQIGQSPTSAQRPAVRSPGLRLGLSRLVRVKPLHPSATSPCP